MKLGSLGIVWLCLMLAAPSWAQEWPCPHPANWKPTNEELQRTLAEHRQWLEKGEVRRSESDGKADLCNADLQGLDLTDADLSKARLHFANLSNADLRGIKLNNAFLVGANLSNADLTYAELNNAYLMGAKLSDAHLLGTKLNNALLVSANLSNVNLSHVEMNNANLLHANLINADLSGTELSDADLRLAKLNDAKLLFTKVAGARMAGADLTSATYAPESPPPDSYVAGITGLSTVVFPAGRETGLVQLRDLLQKAGLRDLEREATFAIENGKTNILIRTWPDDLTGAAEGVFRYVAFDLTTAYGLWPGRALLLIVTLWALLIPVYAWPIWRFQRRPTAGAIYRIWPKDRVELRNDQPTLDNPARVERLHARSLKAITWSAYFSLLSTFQIGFREFSVGTWLTRTQPRNFALEATGWVRTLSGVQSLLSVYLLAMWVLTYFGRPFQ